MDGKIYDIPFRSRSLLSDFACRDGEVESASGVLVSDPDVTDLNRHILNSQPFGYESPYIHQAVPAPDVSFTLVRDILPGWHSHPDMYPAQQVALDLPSASAWQTAARDLLKRFYDEAASCSLFTTPFLVMAAWRTVDGNLLSPSLPVLMIPSSGYPLVVPLGELTDKEMELRIAAPLCSLQWKIRSDERLRDWVGKIASLEILVSRQMDLFSLQTMQACRNVSSDSFCVTSDSLSGKEIESRICSEKFPLAWRPGPSGHNITSLSGFYTVMSLPLASVKTATEFKNLSFNHGSLKDCYGRKEEVPDFAAASLKRAEGAISFKGRTLLWNPSFAFPEFDLRSNSSITPRWIFHPDPEAREFQFSDENGIRRSVPLSRHPLWYGSYFYGGLGSEVNGISRAVEVATGGRSSSFDGVVWYGAWDKADVFKDSLLQNPGCGKILALCRAFRTSGLVATTSPTLYAFTDSGVFLFKQSSSDIFSEAGLISAHILSDPDSIRILDRGIIFVSSEGETILIEGTKVTNCSGSSSGVSSKPVTISGNGSPASVVTRPVKFGSSGAFKSLARIFLRGNFDPSALTLTISGSRDMRRWFVIGRRIGGAAISLCLPPFRFFRIKIDGRLSPGESLQGLSVTTRAPMQ